MGHREEYDINLGCANIKPKDPITVDSKGTWKITYIAGKEGIDVGGAVRITIPHGFTAPQTKAFYEPGFTTVETEDKNLELSLNVIYDIFCRLDKNTGHSGAWGRNIFVKILKGGMEEGDSFTVIYGNRDYYGDEPFSKAGAKTRELSGEAEFIVAVDPDGNRTAPFSGYKRIEKSPKLKLLPSSPDRLLALVSSNINNTSKIATHLIYVDEYNNPIKVDNIFIKQGMYGNKIEKKTTNRLKIKQENFLSTTNPFYISEVTDNKSEDKLFWGDIHGHTIHSDGLGTLDHYYTYGKKTALLDFCAVTDHDDIGPRLSRGEWIKMQDAVRKYNKTNSYITFLGHEYRNSNCDMNIYYPRENGQLLIHTEDNLHDAMKLTEVVKQQNGMIIPHMHFGADWSGFDSKVYRVMEIYSQHGSAEYRGCPREIPYLNKQVQKNSASNEDCYAHEILNLGLRLGFTAGSDTHSGRPGFSDWTRTSRTYLGGLTAVYAKELTRGSIWDALYNRKCYATTGNRSILQFEIDGHPMGSEITSNSGKKRNIKIKCNADGELKKITIFRSGESWIQKKIDGKDIKQKYEDCETNQSDWYYVRIDLKNSEMVWSSPIWVDVN
ncbi:MAG: DUF3604 domain-containing protein [Candidatus Lokiarchaeota archaeon]|nr:DUF3604 domain-containing protein [Candidatus Lokiarchaeota archaeon]